MKTREFPVTCPDCGQQNDVASNVTSDEEGAVPTTGSLMICQNCLGIATLEEDGSLKPVPKEERKNYLTELFREQPEAIPNMLMMVLLPGMLRGAVSPETTDETHFKQSHNHRR